MKKIVVMQMQVDVPDNMSEAQCEKLVVKLTENLPLEIDLNREEEISEQDYREDLFAIIENTQISIHDPLALKGKTKQ